MEKYEQRFVLKYWFLTGLNAYQMHTKLVETLEEKAYSYSQIKFWCKRFRQGDLSCSYLPKSGRTPSDLGPSIIKYIEKYPFASASKMSRHFQCSKSTIISILEDDYDFKKFKRKWSPHVLSDDIKQKRIDFSIMIKKYLEDDQENDFASICTGDESWFGYHYDTRDQFAKSREDVIPIISQKIDSKKTMVTVFFTGTELLVCDCLPKREKYNGEYFTTNILPQLSQEKSRRARRKPKQKLLIHMDNSRCHNNQKVTNYLESNHMERIPHPPYSPDISPCDFWLFGYLKECLKEKLYDTEEELVNEIYIAWNSVTFETLQNVYKEWIIRLDYVIKNGGSYYSK